MATKKYLVLDGAPATTVDGGRIALPTGDAEVHHTDDGFEISVEGAEPITVSAGEFDRLLAEGQIHGLRAVAPVADDPAIE